MGSSTWTARENKLFEDALAVFDQDTPDRWENLSRAVGTKSVDEVKQHYQKLIYDIHVIESGQVPLPNYQSNRVNGRRRR